jgi:parallel beta-helix repeat protein
MGICVIPLRVYGDYSNQITIRSDGSVTPSDAPVVTADNVTYVLTDNITRDILGLTIERDNVVVLGSGHIIQGKGSGSGIFVSNRNNITIANFRIVNFQMGVTLNSSSGDFISNNTISLMGQGIYLSTCANVTISENNINNNVQGIILPDSENIIVSQNEIINNPQGIVLPTSSTVNITILENNIVGGSTAYAYGISGLSSCNRISILRNNITANAGGISFYSCYNNTISQNNMSNNDCAVHLSLGSTNITVSYNFIANNSEGVEITYSNNNRVFRNIVDENKIYGIFVGWSSTDNTIYNNNITRNESYGIFLNASTMNSFIHNNFINNGHQVTTYNNVLDFWDNGFDGNYWSDYNGTDSNQDGIGDTPYIIDANNTDHYPLMAPAVIPEFPSFSVLPLFMVAASLAVIVYKRRHMT